MAAMSRGLAKIGKIITSPISLVIGDKATSALLAIAAAIPGPHQPFAAAAAVAFTTFSQLAAPKPPARGSATNVIIAAEPARPYMIGESYSGGILRWQVGYGDTLKKVSNPFLWQVKVFSGVGPVEQIVQEQFDFEPIGSYFTGFYSSVSQLGLRPEGAALVPPYGAAPGWTSTSKLSGCAAIGSNYKFDRDGKVYASGAPLHGAIIKGEKAYDPRLDSTYPGGSGPCRLGDESTYVYSTNPAVHAGTYAYGRYEDGVRIFGIGIGQIGIDWAAIVDWANDCDANEWECHGTIYEGGQGNDIQAQRVQNLDDICAAGGGRWLVAGALLSFDWHRPRVPLATMTDAEWLEEGGNATAVQSVRDRMNGVRPQYISPAHNWEQITADEIIGTTYRTEDGQAFTQVWPLNLVKDPVQAGQLAAYALTDTREIGPIEIAANQSWRFYKPGETITIDSELLGYTGQAVIMQREFDPLSFAVRLTLKSETPAKHPFALGKVAVPPPTPIIGQTPEERDTVASFLNDPRGCYTLRSSVPQFPVTPGDGEIDIAAFTAVLDDGREISFPADTLTGLDGGAEYVVFWDLSAEDYVAALVPADDQTESSRYLRIGFATTSAAGAFPPPDAPPPGWGGFDGVRPQTTFEGGDAGTEIP